MAGQPDPLAIVQEMQRRMEAMQAKIVALRAERDARQRAQSNQQSEVPSHAPIVEHAQTEPEETNQEEVSSRSRSVHPTNVGRARTLHPFTSTIMEEQMSEKMPLTLEKYDGSGNPEEHLRSFMDAMTIYSPNELVWCRVFPCLSKEKL